MTTRSLASSSSTASISGIICSTAKPLARPTRILFDAELYLTAGAVQGLPNDLGADLRGGIGQNGIRNALLAPIAPIGTISLLADNVS
jgi:ribonucleoside-diphosphate reductase alpha chain